MSTLTPAPRSLPASVAGRRLVPEVMDDPTLDPQRHADALRGLGRINRLSRSADLLWPALLDAAKRQPDRPLRVLDLACGGGDVTIALARRAEHRCGKLGLPGMRFTGLDISPTALGFAHQAAEEAGIDVELRPLDVLSDPLPVDADVAMNSLFLHHLTAEQAVDVLRKMRNTAATVLINDLTRSVVAHAVTVLGTRLLTRSDVVHTDGPRSVRAAWTPGELRALADGAGLTGAEVTPRFPWRMFLRWSAS
ncbi:MAG: methyltransferase domain-containing protein [Planctomycetota bacterium]